jgi:glycosyltransferase involved in cell wall biosynthesis
MSKLSVLIPSRNEKFLQHTIDDVFKKATGDVEVIVTLEGYWPVPELKKNDNLIIVHRGRPFGLRRAVNSSASIASGEFIMKVDAHCAFGEGFDEILKADCEPDWVVVPRRYSLDVDKWDKRRSPIDYLYLECPAKSAHQDLAGKLWNEKNRDPKLKKVPIDDLLTFQGSCYFLHKDYFFELGGLDEELYGTFRKEPQELSFKAWLSGGRVVRNKNTWYAHLHKGKTHGRGYGLARKDWKKGDAYNARWLTNEAWDDQKLDFKWLIDKFMPMPGWEDFEWPERREIK